MKKILLFIGLAMVSTGLLRAQVPAGFNYQAVVRNNAGNVIANQNVSFRISILQDSDQGAAVYVETHAIQTNAYGLANLIVGEGSVENGSFSPDGWGLAPHFIKVEFDAEGGDSYSHLSTTQLLAVPYAFHAQTVAEDKVNDADADASNELQTLSLNGTDLSISEGNTVALPDSPWQSNEKNIYTTSGNVGIGANPGNDSKFKLTVFGGNLVGIGANTNSSNHGAIYATNSGGGPAAMFGSPIQISDGTEGKDKVLTSDADGMTSWKSLEKSPWNHAANDKIFTSAKVGIGNNNPFYKFEVVEEDGHVGAQIKSSRNTALYMQSGEDPSSAWIVWGKGINSNMFFSGLSSDNTFRISNKTASLQGIEVEGDGDVTISHELHRESTGSANMLPMAYGSVANNGNIYGGSDNFTVEKESTGMFLIHLNDEGLTDGYNYAVNVTLLGGLGEEAIGTRWAIAADSLRVYLIDKDGVRVDCGFSFIIYKP